MSIITLGWTGLVGLAGALGALARYLIGRVIVVRGTAAFPWSTLLINITGAFLIGIVSDLTTQHLLTPPEQTVLATGFLGGYTTFSTMSWEGFQLLRNENLRLCLWYLGGTAIPGLFAAFLGLKLGGVL